MVLTSRLVESPVTAAGISAASALFTPLIFVPFDLAFPLAESRGSNAGLNIVCKGLWVLHAPQKQSFQFRSLDFHQLLTLCIRCLGCFPAGIGSGTSVASLATTASSDACAEFRKVVPH